MAKKKILIVDDEPALCRSLKLNLEETGDYEVMTETKGTNAKNVANQFKPDLIVLDFIMPDMDGSEVANQLQRDPGTNSIPFIFLTAIASKEDTGEQGDIIGGNFFLAKPVTTQLLVEAIEKNIGSTPNTNFIDKFKKK